MVDRFERFIYDIAEISRYYHKIAADEMVTFGLKGTCAVYFTALDHAPEGLTAAQLAEKCSRDKADVSRSVSAMEKGGFVRREGDPYRARLLLTDHGREAAQAINQRVCVAMTCGGRGMTDAQREALYQALDLIVENLGAISREGLPEHL